MRYCLRWAWLLLLAGCLAAEVRRAPLALTDPLQDKNFYLLSALERSPAARALIAEDAALRRVAAARRTALIQAPDACAANAACYAHSMRWSDEEAAQAGAALRALAAQPAMVRLLADTIRPSGTLERYSKLDDGAMLEAAWRDATRKMNRALELFLPAEAPPDGATARPQSNLAAYDLKSPAYARMVRIMAAIVGNGEEPAALFFSPTLHFTLELLRLHGHDEAGRHEPLEAGENRAAVARIASTDWTRYPYTAIVTLGNGPERADVALSPVGRLRLTLAARAYREQKAPFILVTGGYAHPGFTPYCEAVEMKKALMREFGVPEEAILVDPQASRTTTNLRNAARLIYRYAIPFERKALVLTDQLHSATIEAPSFAERCRRDFGFEPVRLASRISPFELEFTPLIESLHVDANDLMDP